VGCARACRARTEAAAAVAEAQIAEVQEHLFTTAYIATETIDRISL
jgi:hypothetical protein